jgi:glycolate oxidase iron-sulfur subunit
MKTSDESTQHSHYDALLGQCVHCGFCLATCPTYALWGQEMDSPRGRIYLMQLKRDGTVDMTTEWVRHFDTCLGCMACMPACPSGVDYGQLIEITRAEIAEKTSVSRAPGCSGRCFPDLAASRAMRATWWSLALHQRPDWTLVRRTGLLDRLPLLKAMEALMPGVSRKEATPRVTPAAGARRGRVGMLLGCVQREFLSEVNAATARVLAAEGYEVVAPPEQPCCGALLISGFVSRSAPGRRRSCG